MGPQAEVHADRELVGVVRALGAHCERPLVLEPITAEYIHGTTGIDGVDVFDPETPLQETHAIDFIVETLREAIPLAYGAAEEMMGDLESVQ